jgi:hypothetical protein
MRPPEQHWKHAQEYEEAAKQAKHPESREAFLRNAKRFKALAKTSMALSEPKGHG